jgi:hypothetical protein
VDAEQIYANCPKYIAPREVISRLPVPTRPESRGQSLEWGHRGWIENADTFFIATSHPDAGADCSHRGGPPGFVRVEDGELQWDDFPGNAMFNTLGNLNVNPACGLVFVDWKQARLLQLSGNARLVWHGTDRRVHFMTEQWREAPANVALQWSAVS